MRMFRKASVETALASAMHTRMVMLISLGWHQLDMGFVSSGKLRGFVANQEFVNLAILVHFGGV